MRACWSEPTTKNAYQLSWVSLLFTLLAALAGILLYVKAGSSLCLVYGLENCVDFFSSAVVLWRFFAPSKLTPELEAKLAQRETRASLAISMVLVLLGLFVLVAAIDDFTRGQDDPDQIRVIVAVSFFSFLIFGVLAIYKFRYARILNSASLYKDGVCSLLGTVLALALFINSLIIESRAAAWWLDPTVAIVASLLTLVYGCYGVYHAKVKEGLPIFSCKWWFTSKGEGKSASDSSRPGPEHFRSSPGVELPPTQDEDDEDDVEGVV